MFSRRRIRSRLGPRTASLKMGCINEAAARRRVRPGYPIMTPFQSLKEVREYFSGDTVVCLLCGRNLKVLGKHLKDLHGITKDEYREQYNISYSTGLVCETTAATMSRNSKITYANGNNGLAAMTMEEKAEARRRLDKAVRHQRKGKLARKENRNHLRSWEGYAETVTPEQILAVIQKMIDQDMTLEEVCSQPGEMCSGTVQRAVGKNAELKAKYDQAKEMRSFAAQARSTQLGQRYTDEVIFLKDVKKKTFREISKKTHTNEDTVSRYYHKGKRLS